MEVRVGTESSMPHHQGCERSSVLALVIPTRVGQRCRFIDARGVSQEVNAFVVVIHGGETVTETPFGEPFLV
jgi:hypothetical protein